MNVYDVRQLRNIALVGHQGAGKTLLTEAMLFASGTLNRMGSIEEGNTASDYRPSEIERKMSVFASILRAEWKGTKINILDAPGYSDFIGEVASTVHVADTALFVLNAVEGIQVGTELAWDYASRKKLPSLFVVNHIDKPEYDFDALAAALKERFGRAATVVQFPVGDDSVVDILLMKQLKFNGHKTEPTESEIDAAYRDRAEELHNELIESIAENDEKLMEMYFEKGTLDESEMREGLHASIVSGGLYPIFVTSASTGVGVTRLLNFIEAVCPAPSELPTIPVQTGAVKVEASSSPVAFVFRTMAEQHVGDFSFFKVYSGCLEAGMDLENAQTSTIERLGQLFSINGKNRDAVPKMYAGDIGALIKLKNTHTGNTLRQKGKDVVMAPIEFPAPRYTVAVKTVKEGEEDKLAAGLHQLIEEDPALVLTQDQHLKQLVLAGQGEMHLEITKRRLKSKYGVEIEYDRPKLAYRETIQIQSRSSYRHKKQTGGAGQFADISMLVEPINGEFVPPEDIQKRGEVVFTTDWGSRIEFIDAIVGGVIDMKRFFSPIQKGIQDALSNGPVAGYPVGDVRIVIYDGGMHPVDSNENAFKTASRMCFREAFRKAQPVLLEPIFELEVLTPEANTGDVMGDLNTRRARIQGIEAEGPYQKVVALVPEAELFRYSTILRSITQGRGVHRARFHHYEAMPRHVQDKVVADAAAEVED